jgi:hypothetical protein
MPSIRRILLVALVAGVVASGAGAAAARGSAPATPPPLWPASTATVRVMDSGLKRNGITRCSLEPPGS